MGARAFPGLSMLLAVGVSFALLLALGTGCGNSMLPDLSTGGTGPVCQWENLCACQCAGAPKSHVTLDACESLAGKPCNPAVSGSGGSGGSGGGGGGGTAGGATGGTGTGGGNTYQGCTLDHRVCIMAT
jgi:hypothetical protein